MADFTGKVALVTGGASGMGASFARIVVRDGGKVAIADLNSELGAAMVAELGADNASFASTDVSAFAAMTAFVNGAVERFGAVDVMFNNAGIGGMGTTMDLSEEAFRHVLQVDLFSVFFGCKAVLPHMLKVGKGAIVNNASISGLRGDYGMTAYNTAKGAVVNYSRALAMDVARQGVRVNVICPGTIDTPLFAGLKTVPEVFDKFVNAVPMGRIGKPEEVAEVVAFLASDRASYMTGTIVEVDGGVTATTGFPDLAPYMAEMMRAFGTK